MVDDLDDAHQLVVVDETLSLVRPHGATIDVALNVMRDTFANAVGDVASLAQAVMIALREAGFDDLYLPVRHLTNEPLDESNPDLENIATYQFAIAISDISAVSQALTTVASAVTDPTPFQDTAQDIAVPQSDPIPLEIETRIEVIDLTKTRAEVFRRERARSDCHNERVRAAFGSLLWSSRTLDHRNVYVPHSST